MSEEPAEDSFPADLDAHLRAQGLAGAAARVWGDGTFIHVAGDRSGRISIPVAEIERLRFGMSPGRHSRPEVRLWRRGGEEPLLLRSRPRQPSYPPVMRRIVAAVVAERGTEAVELGTTRRAALSSAALQLLQLAAMLSLAVYTYRNGFWPLSIGCALLAPLMIPAVAESLRSMPRPLRAMEDMERVFPKLPAAIPKQRIGS